jgi:hypothetical protein
MAQNVVLSGNILSVHSCMCIEFMLSHWLSKIFIPNFVYHHFWPKCFVNLMYLLWFMIVDLMSCDDASQNSEFVFWGQRVTFDWPIVKNKFETLWTQHVDLFLHEFFIKKTNHTIAIQCHKCRRFEPKSETSMCFKTLRFNLWLARCPLSHSSVTTKTYANFSTYFVPVGNFKLSCITHYSQKLHHIELGKLGCETWSQYHTPIATELQSQVRNFHSYLIEILCFTSLFNYYLWSNDSFLKTTLDTKHTVNDNCSSVFKINTLLHIMLSQTRDLQLCTENLVWHSIRTWKFHHHKKHNPLWTLNPQTPPIQGACRNERRKGRQEKGNRGRQKYLTYPPNRKIDRQCPSKYHKPIKALHGYEAS